MPRRTDAERAPGQMESAGYGTGALGRVGGGAKTENLTLLFFEFLLLYNVRLHFRLSPAIEVGLTLPGDAKSLRGDVPGDGAAGSTITRDVPPQALGIARERQTNLDGWAEPKMEAYIIKKQKLEKEQG